MTLRTETLAAPPMGRKPSVLFISDAHFGHRAIGNYRVGIDSEQQNFEHIADYWQQNVHPSSHVWMLGDMAFTPEREADLNNLPGVKHWVLGNHDVNPSEGNVYGITRKYGLWLSHAPVHPAELRGYQNVHGHVHDKTVEDPRYFNVSVDNTNRIFKQPMISLDQLRVWIEHRLQK